MHAQSGTDAEAATITVALANVVYNQVCAHLLVVLLSFCCHETRCFKAVEKKTYSLYMWQQLRAGFPFSPSEEVKSIFMMDFLSVQEVTECLLLEIRLQHPFLNNKMHICNALLA